MPRYWLFYSILAATVAISLVLSMVVRGGQKPPKAPPGDRVELGAVVQAIKDALDESEKYQVRNFPPFQSATVSVMTTVEKQVGGGVKLFVFNLGATGTLDNASTLTFELSPPAPPKGPRIESFSPVDIKNALASQIAVAKLGFVSVNAQTQALQANKVEIEIAFTVKTEVSGGVDTGTILPVGITINGTYSQETGNTIRLVFSNKGQ